MTPTTLAVVAVMLVLLIGYNLVARKSTIVGPWQGCHESHYIFAFRERLNAIVDRLYAKKPLRGVYLRFNPNETCAEIYIREAAQEDCLIARVHVHGECGCPYEVLVFSDFDEKIRSSFRSLEETGVRVTFKAFDAWKPKKQT